MTHTPGPWRINREHLKYSHEGMYQSGLVIESPEEGASIAQLCEWQAPLEAEANAALIAAAPALYEALKQLHAHTRTVDAAYRNGLNDTDPLYRAVDEALRLAEGGKP